MSLVKSFARNPLGRDFVVGDIHGCFDELHELMRRVIQFDPTRDRMFAVGDLVDKGPKSVDVLDWLRQPWFHSVRGNHEQRAIDVYNGTHDMERYARNGGSWFLALSPKEQERMVLALEHLLPLMIEVDTLRGPVGIVHADIQGASWRETARWVDDPGLSKTAQRTLTNTIMWSRQRYESYAAGFDTGPVGDLHRMYVGHVPLYMPTTIQNVVYLDTGICRGNALTCVEITGRDPDKFIMLRAADHDPQKFAHLRGAMPKPC